MYRVTQLKGQRNSLDKYTFHNLLFDDDQSSLIDQ